VFDRIFLYVEDRRASAPAIDLALSLAGLLGSRLFATCIINTSDLPEGPSRQAKLADAEEEAWQALYEIEDDAFGREISISLLLDQGNPLERLLDLARSYQAKLIVAAARNRLALPELLRQSPVPVILAPEQLGQTSETDERAV